MEGQKDAKRKERGRNHQGFESLDRIARCHGRILGAVSYTVPEMQRKKTGGSFLRRPACFEKHIRVSLVGIPITTIW